MLGLEAENARTWRDGDTVPSEVIEIVGVIDEKVRI